MNLMQSNARLLILSCSRCKRPDPSALSAIERYNGPAFRVLRRYLSGQKDARLAMYILSAEYGLISSDFIVPYYDRCMTLQRAELLRPAVLAELKRVTSSPIYQEMCVCLGKNYYKAIEGYERALNTELEVTLATGGTGERLSRLYKWLYGANGDEQPALSPNSKNCICFRGSEYAITKNQVLELAHKAIAQGNKNAVSCTAWYVEVAGQRVSPKWLVRELTGWGVGEFHTDAARRFLNQIGIEVKR